MPGHYIQLYFSDVQPAPMLWCIVYFQFFRDTPCFLRRIPFVQGCRFVRVQIIHHKDNLLSIRVHGVHQILDFFRSVNGCAVFPYTHMVDPSECFHKGKDADSAIADILRIGFPVTSGNHRQRIPGFSQELVWFFIHAHNGMFFIIGKLINVKDILHAGYELRVFFCGDAPVFVFVRSKFVFFKVLRIASLPTGVSRITLASSSSRRIVHRECPSGTGPQASSISLASVRPSTLRLALSEFMLLLNSVTASIPPLIYFVTVLVTVAMQTPLDFALCSWVKAFPCASSRSRIIWHLLRIVFEVSFLRITDFNFFNSFSVRWILYFFGLAIGITAVSFIIHQNNCDYQNYLVKYQQVSTLGYPDFLAFPAFAISLGSFSGFERFIVISIGPYSVSVIHFSSLDILSVRM